jgi:hypothetical protein
MKLKEPTNIIDNQLIYKKIKRSKSIQKKKKINFFEAIIQKCESVKNKLEFKNDS